MLNDRLEGYQSFWKREKAFIVPRKPLALVVCAWLCVLCLITLIYALSYWLAKEKQTQTQRALDLLDKKYTPTHPSFVAAFSVQNKREQQNSAQYFVYLGTFPHQDYWLTHINLNLTTGTMQFTGQTIHPRGIDDFLRHLAYQDSPLTQWMFSAAQFSQSKTSSTTTNVKYDFSLNATAPWATIPVAGEKKS